MMFCLIVGFLCGGPFGALVAGGLYLGVNVLAHIVAGDSS
jgi:hypothetical protein